MSQTELADRIGVTFQQVQKYEKGVNRIGAGRLQRISEALEVPISFFFGGQAGRVSARDGSDAESIFGFMQTSGSVRIVKAFHKIKSRKARQLLVEMAEELADERPDATLRGEPPADMAAPRSVSSPSIGNPIDRAPRGRFQHRASP